MPEKNNSEIHGRVRLLRVCSWLIVAGVLVWQFKVDVKNAWAYGNRRDEITDFDAFYAAGNLALRGEDIYDFKSSGLSRRPYLYPPTFAIFPMLPLALLSHNAALVVFTLINFALLIASCWLLCRALWKNQSTVFTAAIPPPELAIKRWLLLPETGVMLAGVVASRFILNNMRHGNANMYVVFALALGLDWMMQHRSRLREFSSGLAIALATAIKVTPGLFGLYLLWSWRRWGMLGGALGLIFFLVMLPATRFGLDGTKDLLKKYSSHVSAAARGDGDEDAIGHPGGSDQKQIEGGISIRGVVMRYLTPRPMLAKDSADKYYVNFVELDETVARRICQGIEIALMLLTVYFTIGRFARSNPAGIALSWGLITLTMVIISPLTRKAHLSVLLIPAAVMIALIQQRRVTGFARKFCIAALAAICLQGAIFSVEILGKFRSDWLQGAGLGLLFLLPVYAANAYALRSMKNESALNQIVP